MERSQQALGRAQFRAKGKWYLAQEVDSLLEELSVCLEEDGREREALEGEARSLRQENARLAQELQEARARLAQWEEASQEARQRRVCQELERERDSLIGDIKALRRFRASPEWQRDGGAYIPHPATWLRDRRWEDDDLWNGGPDLPPEEPEPPRYGWD